MSSSRSPRCGAVALGWRDAPTGSNRFSYDPKTVAKIPMKIAVFHPFALKNRYFNAEYGIRRGYNSLRGYFVSRPVFLREENQIIK